MRRFLFLSFFLLILSFIPVGFKRFTCGFKLAKMWVEAPFRSDWEVPSLLTEQELQTILGQPYTYLDRGAQCYVFGSQDGKYVVKFFRHDRPFLKKKKVTFQQKLDHVFAASVLAFNRAQDETGILHLHLNLTDRTLPIFRAKGPLGQRISLHLDQYRFAIQKKVEPFRDSLLKAYHASDEEGMKRRIDSFLAVLHSRASKGIRNSDPALGRNFGFMGERAYEIDFGNYSLNMISKEWEIAHYTHRLRSWLSENAPEWVPYLDAQSTFSERDN